MIGTDTSVICPGRERAEEGPKHHAGESEYRCDERSSPASAEVGELGNGLGKKNLVGVALEVAQNRGPEDGGDDDDAEESSADVVERVGECRIPQDLAIAVADGAETFRRNAEEGEREPDKKIHVGREALEAELEFEG